MRYLALAGKARSGNEGVGDASTGDADERLPGAQFDRAVWRRAGLRTKIHLS